MIYRFSKKYFLTIILIFNIAQDSFAITKPEVENFMLQIASLMNRRNPNEISNFYKFNSNTNARFIKKSFLYHNDDSSKEAGTEDLNLSVDDYTLYLKNILVNPTKYAYYSTIEKVDFENNEALVSLQVNELSTKVVYNNTNNSHSETQTLVAANCNYTLGVKNAQLVIMGMNCIEKITKKHVN